MCFKYDSYCVWKDEIFYAMLRTNSHVVPNSNLVCQTKEPISVGPQTRGLNFGDMAKREPLKCCLSKQGISPL